VVPSAEQDPVVDARRTIVGPPHDVVAVRPRDRPVATGGSAAAVPDVEGCPLRDRPRSPGPTEVQHLAVTSSEQSPEVGITEQPRDGSRGQLPTVARAGHLAGLRVEQFNGYDEVEVRTNATGPGSAAT